ncbi:MAG: hypothetical protein GXO64_01330 [Candidatus Micrarchaeota archaeon]|nr:hypothetical protein [Candidatus Micrarchaeota archaeon]
MIGETFSFFNGILASLSPCTFPMYPIIFAYFFMEKKSLDKKRITMFISGYVISMLLLSFLLMSLSGIFLVSDVLKFAGAGFMIIFGVFMFTKKEFNIHFSLKKINNPFIFGMIFAFMVNPCSFPFLLSTLTISLTSAAGYVYILLYGLGVIIPPTIFALLGKSIMGRLEKIYSRWWIINYITGAFLIIAGIVTAFDVSINKVSLLVSSALLLAFVLALVFFGFKSFATKKGKALKCLQMGTLVSFWVLFTYRCQGLVSDSTTMMCSSTCEICTTCLALFSIIAVISLLTIYLSEHHYRNKKG